MTVIVTLARRSAGEPDNYKETCLFLNDSFRRKNTCAISLQNDMSIYGVQAGLQIAQLSRGVTGQSLGEANWPGERARGEVLKPTEYKVGDLWFLRKADGRTQYELAFEIVSVNDLGLTIRYEVKSFAFAGR